LLGDFRSVCWAWTMNQKVKAGQKEAKNCSRRSTGRYHPRQTASARSIGRYHPHQNCFGEYRAANFRVFFTSRLTEPLADGHSCSRWANTRPRNFCTAGSIVGFPSARKHGLKYGPKVGQKHVRANTPNPKNTHIQANRLSSGASRRVQNRAQK
jgi:hypothetical protein